MDAPLASIEIDPLGTFTQALDAPLTLTVA
jgi:hypothetical protein